MSLYWFLFVRVDAAGSINCNNGKVGGNPALCVNPSARACLVSRDYGTFRVGDRCSNEPFVECACQPSRKSNTPAPVRPSTPVTTTPSTPVTTTPSTPKTTTSRTPVTTTPSAPKTTTPSAPKTTTPSAPKTTTPSAPETTTSRTPVTTTTRPSTPTRLPAAGTPGTLPPADRCDSDDACASNRNHKIICSLGATGKACSEVPMPKTLPRLMSKSTTPASSLDKIFIISIIATWILIIALVSYIVCLYTQHGPCKDDNRKNAPTQKRNERKMARAGHTTIRSATSWRYIGGRAHRE